MTRGHSLVLKKSQRLVDSLPSNGTWALYCCSGSEVLRTALNNLESREGSLAFGNFNKLIWCLSTSIS